MVYHLLILYCYEKIRNKLQEELYIHIIYSTWMNHLKYHSIELLTRMINYTDTITNFLVTAIPNIISLLVMFVSSFIVLIYITCNAIIALVIFQF